MTHVGLSRPDLSGWMGGFQGREGTFDPFHPARVLRQQMPERIWNRRSIVRILRKKREGMRSDGVFRKSILAA